MHKPVRAISIDASPILTQILHHLTLVIILAKLAAPHAAGAKLQELGGSVRRAFFTATAGGVSPPCLAHGAAAGFAAEDAWPRR